jgi:hypothetical protein
MKITGDLEAHICIEWHYTILPFLCRWTLARPSVELAFSYPFLESYMAQ